MPLPKFRIRLGSQEHLTLSGKRYIPDYRPDTYNCRLSLRCGPLQASGTADFTSTQLRGFVNSVIGIVAQLRGDCILAPIRVGTFSIHVSVSNTAQIVTRIEITRLTSGSNDAIGWNATAQFQTPWDEYYHPIDVDSLDVAQLKGLAGHIPTIE
jgi:hypothetical protein